MNESVRSRRAKMETPGGPEKEPFWRRLHARWSSTVASIALWGRVWRVSDPVLVAAVISDILTVVVALPAFLCGYCGHSWLKIEPHSQIFRSRRASLGWAGQQRQGDKTTTTYVCRGISRLAAILSRNERASLDGDTCRQVLAALHHVLVVVLSLSCLSTSHWVRSPAAEVFSITLHLLYTAASDFYRCCPPAWQPVVWLSGLS